MKQLEFRHSPDDIIYIKKYESFFVGTGKDDFSIKDNFALKTYNLRVEIDSVSDVYDTFKVSFDGGITWEISLVPITCLYQYIDDGLWIVFNSKNGHTAGDYWSFAGGFSSYPMKWFLTKEPLYSLPISPPNIRWRWYMPGVFNKIYDNTRQYDLDINWLEGDMYISKKEEYDASYNPNEAVPHPELIYKSNALIEASNLKNNKKTSK